MPQTSDSPSVSVVIPVYNADWCIGCAIDSVLDQTFTDFELIVVNDGCTDNTTSILAHYGNALRIIEQPNRGLSAARNRGASAARGRYVAFLDADDRWLPTKLAQQVTLMTEHPDLAFCSTSALLEAPDGTQLGEWRHSPSDLPPLHAIFLHNAFVAGSGSAVLVRRDVLTAAGGFDEALRSLEDIDMWMRLAAIGRYACIEEPLVAILKRPESMSGNISVMRASALQVIRKNRHLLPPSDRNLFWRHAYAGALCDYAKSSYRVGKRWLPLADLFHAFLLAPLSRGRLAIGLALIIFSGRRIDADSQTAIQK